MNAPRKALFRESALDRLSTSERLDRTLSVSSAREWLALVMLGAMAASVLAWSVLGEVSTFVPARGILLGRGGVIVDAVSAGNGALTRILPRVGDRVEQGALVGVVVDSEAVELHRTALALVVEERRALEVLRAAGEAEDAVHVENAGRQRRRLEVLEQSARASVEAARAFLESHRRLFEEGFVARVDLGQSQQALDAAQRELFAVLGERDELELGEVRRRNEQRAEIAEQEASLHASRARGEPPDGDDRVRRGWLESGLLAWYARSRIMAAGRCSAARARSLPRTRHGADAPPIGSCWCSRCGSTGQF